MDITKNITAFASELKARNATLIAVSKTKPVEAIQEAYQAGQRDFGENKVQEMVAKHAELPNDIRWHMIGHLQRNKVKYIAPFVHLIHGVDSLRLLEAINKEGVKCERQVPCLLQVHIARESTKFGMSEDEVIESIIKTQEFTHIQLRGLMGMATLTGDEQVIKSEFDGLKSLFNRVREQFSIQDTFDILSMGMSGDYPLALESGSNMVRVGSAIFGKRN